MIATEILQSHEYADVFPMMSDAEMAGLVDDIRENGLREDIVIYQGQILDGRNRYAACMELGLEPTFADYGGENPLQFVLSHNLHRRHLSESQRAMVASRVANLERGSNQHSREDGPIGPPSISNDKAAEMLTVGKTSVKRAKKVQKEGSEALIQAVESGNIKVSAAETLTKLPKEEQDQVIEQGDEAVKKKVTEIRKGAKDAPDKKLDVSKIQYIPELGMQIYGICFSNLKRISDNDKDARKCFEKLSAYCKKRLDNLK